METPEQHNGTSRATILREIGTPLTFFALVVLVVEVILTVLASKATGIDFTLLVCGMIVTLLASIVAVARHGDKPRGRSERASLLTTDTPIKHDVFISSPQAAYGADARKYQRNRTEVLKLVDSFRKECKFKSVHCAVHEMPSTKDFEAPDISARADVQAIRESRLFVLYYPQKVVSSALFEAGAATVLGKPSLFLVKKRIHLPFLMRQADSAFSNVRILECEGIDDILGLIARHGEGLFSPSEALQP